MIAVGLATVLSLAPTAATVADRRSSVPEFTAIRGAESILVSFDLHAENYEDLDLRLSRESVTVVSWVIELHRVAHLGFDRLFARAMTRAFARPLTADRFSISRSVNGRVTESGVVVDRREAHRWLTSFSTVPLFDLYQLAPDADHVLTIMATVEGGGEPRVVTSRLARAPLLR
jgi:hypothetical protein